MDGRRGCHLGTCPYQKLHREQPPTAWHQARERATPETETRVTPSLWTTEVRGCTTAGVRASTPGQTAPRATVRRRDVRSGDANRRRVGLKRSRRRMALEQPAGRAHPCPVRGEFATRDSTRGSASGGGATSARSTRQRDRDTPVGGSQSHVQRTDSARENEAPSALLRCPSVAREADDPIRRLHHDPG